MKGTHNEKRVCPYNIDRFRISIPPSKAVLEEKLSF
jgi:hypothetical protein